ncbi:NAD(P)H-dependent oxidoreductase [Actinomadura rugatobispora]|uniref:NAD(P)H-dependent oxidoreductase n=1 Tax=Actinomadura rugatobispora TaxID=1994 RepID=A0ABW1A015_9ACTN|nr:NAD(P)H-dependent oxidoreductase [Actinomadura rugatobispora]
MNVLWVYAHPEPRSLNGALRDEGLHTLKELGHDVRESDLYAMGWNPVVTAADYAHDPGGRLLVGKASEHAYRSGTLSEDVRAELEKLAWADAVVLQFPLWWLGPPAILKGWVDRVFVQGFAYGVKDGDGRPLRYGDGKLTGKRAMVVTTVGARAAGFGARGIHGEAEQVLFGIQHGTFFYTGMEVVPPVLIYGAHHLSADEYSGAGAELRRRLRELPDAEPIPFRRERSGDYDDDLALRPDVVPGDTGLAVHRS